MGRRRSSTVAASLPAHCLLSAFLLSAFLLGAFLLGACGLKAAPQPILDGPTSRFEAELAKRAAEKATPASDTKEGETPPSNNTEANQ